jgi:hypothetical protein
VNVDGILTIVASVSSTLAIGLRLYLGQKNLHEDLQSGLKGLKADHARLARQADDVASGGNGRTAMNDNEGVSPDL